jgi:hypothetical protein
MRAGERVSRSRTFSSAQAHCSIAASEKIVSARRRYNGCEATARLSNKHASRVRYPDTGRYTPKIDKSA